MLIHLFLTMLTISVSIGVIVLFLITFSSFFQKRYSAKWKYWLWLFIALRLLIPFNFMELPILSPMTPQTAPIPIADGNTGAINSTNGYTTHIDAAPQDEVTKQKTTPSLTVINYVILIWFTGCVVFISYQGAGYYVFRKKVLRSSTRGSNELQKLADLYSKTMHIHSSIPVLISKDAYSPLLIGFFRPVIVLPEEYQTVDVSLVIHHELIHYRRHDTWYNLLLVAANAVHWFNPLIYLMVREANNDLELSCDDEVLWSKSFEERKEYAEIIIACISSQKTNRSMLSTYFSSNTKKMRERFENIMDTKKRNKGIAAFAIAILVIGILSGVKITASASNKQESKSPSGTGVTYIEKADDSSETPSIAEQYALYQEYDLIYKEEDSTLYYNGQLVRYFEDSYPIGEYGEAIVQQYINELGVIDVYAIRDLTQLKPVGDGGYDPSGQVTGVALFSQEEFDHRDIDALLSPIHDAIAVTSADEFISAKDLEELYSVYADFGLLYNSKSDSFLYNDVPVRHFFDLMYTEDVTSDGRSSTAGTMRIHNNSKIKNKSAVDVYAIRDYSQLDNEGYGKLIGISTYTQEEFDERTKDWNKPVIMSKNEVSTGDYAADYTIEN